MEEKRIAPRQVSLKSQSTGDKKRVLKASRENTMGHTKDREWLHISQQQAWTPEDNGARLSTVSRQRISSLELDAHFI